jgi:K+-transporting ATPase ATPase C chain
VNEPCPAVPFVARYFGVPVHCAHPHTDYRGGRLVIVRGSAPSHPAVPADAVTASASGLDPDISPAYARIQERCVAAARQVPLSVVAAIVRAHTAGRTLGFLGAPTVDVLAVNVALDERYPMR